MTGSQAARASAPGWDRGRTLIIIGHRGSAAPATENTLEALAHASSAGAAGVEVDVRLCASGEVVVLHDPDLARVTGTEDRRAVATLPLPELAAVRLAGGERVPLLVEVLAACRRRGLLLNIELKRDVPSRLRLVWAVAQLLRGDRTFTRTIVVSSFDPAMLAAFRLLAPAVPTALLAHRDPDYPVWHQHLVHLAQPLGCQAIHLEHPLVTAGSVERYHRQGLRVVAWTVNSPTRAAVLSELGIDGLITDHPARLLGRRS